MTYSLTGADEALFSIDQTTGEVSFKSAADFENAADQGANNVYNLSIEATDQHGQSASHDVAITIGNVNDNSPTFAAPSSSITMEENIFEISAPTAVDADGANILTYSLSGTDANLFIVDTATGAVTFKKAPDYEHPTNTTETIYTAD